MLSVLNFLDLRGSVFIDGVDISHVKHDTLRRSITTIPQDAVILPGSVRKNLLPFDLMSEADESEKGKQKDDQLEEVLSSVGLLDAIKSKGGLDANIDDVHLSAGQKQLMNIARALLHHLETGSKVVLMDEVTSSMDHATDKQLQDVMNATFKDCTRIVISHRASGFQNCDIVVWLRDGMLDKTEARDNTD